MITKKYTFFLNFGDDKVNDAGDGTGNDIMLKIIMLRMLRMMIYGADDDEDGRRGFKAVDDDIGLALRMMMMMLNIIMVMMILLMMMKIIMILDLPSGCEFVHKSSNSNSPRVITNTCFDYHKNMVLIITNTWF